MQANQRMQSIGLGVTASAREMPSMPAPAADAESQGYLEKKYSLFSLMIFSKIRTHLCK